MEAVEVKILTEYDELERCELDRKVLNAEMKALKAEEKELWAKMEELEANKESFYTELGALLNLVVGV